VLESGHKTSPTNSQRHGAAPHRRTVHRHAARVSVSQAERFGVVKGRQAGSGHFQHRQEPGLNNVVAAEEDGGFQGRRHPGGAGRERSEPERGRRSAEHRSAWACYLKASRRTPTTISVIPPTSRPLSRSPRKITASPTAMTTLSLSTGATWDAFPNWSARK
jgi:hypothetical protein